MLPLLSIPLSRSLSKLRSSAPWLLTSLVAPWLLSLALSLALSELRSSASWLLTSDRRSPEPAPPPAQHYQPPSTPGTSLRPPSPTLMRYCPLVPVPDWYWYQTSPGPAWPHRAPPLELHPLASSLHRTTSSTSPPLPSAAPLTSTPLKPRLRFPIFSASVYWHGLISSPYDPHRPCFASSHSSLLRNPATAKSQRLRLTPPSPVSIAPQLELRSSLFRCSVSLVPTSPCDESKKCTSFPSIRPSIL